MFGRRTNGVLQSDESFDVCLRFDELRQLEAVVPVSIRLFTLMLGSIGVRQYQIPIPDGFSAVTSPSRLVQIHELFYAPTKLAEILFSCATLPLSLDALEISMTIVDIEFELDHGRALRVNKHKIDSIPLCLTPNRWVPFQKCSNKHETKYRFGKMR